MDKIQFIDLHAQKNLVLKNVKKRFDEIFSHGQYILGPENQECEDNLAYFAETKHAITCSNGSDALLMSLMALDHQAGDAVICPSFSFIATAEMVPYTGATPVFVDVDPVSFNISLTSCEEGILHARSLGLNPKSIIAVDLFGAPADYNGLKALANKYGMFLISDSAQGFGCSYNGGRAATIADITTTSFFPAKPLGCYGDGGAIFTNCPELEKRLRSIRVHGMGEDKYQNIRLGLNARMDTFQSAVILEKLKIFENEIHERNKIANYYLENIDDTIQCPLIDEGNTSTWAQYTLVLPNLTCRQEFCKTLMKEEIPTAIYYPIPIHRQRAYNSYASVLDTTSVSDDLAKRVVSIPMHPYLQRSQQDHIINVINKFKFEI